MSGALDGLRIVEVGEGKALAYAGKLLCDLGAEVIKIEPPGGDALRAYGPFPGDQPHPERSGLFIFLNGSKRGSRLDIATAEGRAGLEALLGDADVLLHSFRPDEAARLGLSPEPLSDRHPALVVCAITPYGSSGPYANWRGYALQAYAGSGVAFRVGDPEREPLTAPFDQAELQHGGLHAAAAVALALVHRDRSGRGQFVDISVLEAVTTAVSGYGLPIVVYRGRPPPERSGRRFGSMHWGLFASSDGDFAAYTMLDRHWHEFIDLMERPDWTDDPRFASIVGVPGGAQSADEREELVDRLEAWFRERPSAAIWETTKRRRISFHPVHTVGQVMESDQLAARGFLVPAPGDHPPLLVPGAPYRLSETPWRPPGPPPTLAGEPATGWSERPRPPSIQPLAPSREGAGTDDAPLAGIRVIDLGQVWAGPQLGRYLADYGADVIAISTGSRARAGPPPPGPEQPVTWEGFFRNRRSLSLDLTKPRAVALFRELLEHADVMIDNFTPRVLPGFGLDYEDLAAAYPRLVITALSAAGRDGPWSDLLSYGPTLTALYGVKSVFGYAEDGRVMEDASDLDPISATYGMVAIMAALYQRDRSGRGQFIEVAQGETGFCGVAEAAIEFSWNRRDLGPQGNRHRVLAPHGIYPCAGDDAWIAIACGSEEEWAALARCAGRPDWIGRAAFATAGDRRATSAELDAAIAEWTRRDSPEALASRLQEAGVAAFPVMNVVRLLADPHYRERRDFFDLGPDFPGDQLLDGNPWHLAAAPPRLRRPVPLPGQHNEEVLGELLGLTPQAVRELEAEGVVA